MKKTAYIIFFLALSTCFVMVYYAGYYFATQKIDKNDTVKFSNNEEDNPALSDDADPVDLGDDVVITKDTQYILESYNIQTEMNNKETLELPVDLIGLNREEVINYISKNTVDFASENEEVANVQLISFSSNSIVLRRSYNPTVEDVSTYKYWLTDVDGYIVVYKEDKTTVYFNTDISTSVLPEDERLLIEEGKYIKNVHDLYNYLESYTS